MRAIWRGQVVADSDRTLEIAGYRYFPREAVRMDVLRPVARTPADLACPHGVQFYDLVDGTGHSRRAAWSYPDAYTEVTRISGLISFEPALVEVHLDGTRLRPDPLTYEGA